MEEKKETIQPVDAKYCEICKWPSEFCCYGPSFSKCKPWLIENRKEFENQIEEFEKIAEEQEKHRKNSSMKEESVSIEKPKIKIYRQKRTKKKICYINIWN